MDDKIINSENKIKTYKKIVNFFNISLEPSFIPNNKTISEILYEIFENIFKDKNNVVLDEVRLELINLTKNSIFASICKTSEPDILTEIKDGETNSNLDMSQLIFENYTYFFIDFNLHNIAIIKTQSIQSSYEYIIKLIKNHSLINVNIVPFKKTDKEIKNLIITEFSLNFFNNGDRFIELNDINKNDCEIEQYNIKIKLKKSWPSLNIKLLNMAHNQKETLKKFNISTENENIDLLHNIFTKEVKIELTKNCKNELDKIENLLSIELHKIINC